jgi:hypothetical protein
VPARIVGELCDHLEAELPVELGRLKAMGRDEQLPATAPHGFGLGLCYQTTADAAAANGRCNPDLTQLAGLSPRVAGGTCHDVLRLVSQKDTETPGSAYAGCGNVELIQPILQKPDVGGGGLFDLEVTHLPHSLLKVPSQLMAA